VVNETFYVGILHSDLLFHKFLDNGYFPYASGSSGGISTTGEAESGNGDSLARLPQGRHARRHNQYGEGSAGSNAQKAIQGEKGGSSAGVGHMTFKGREIIGRIDNPNRIP
jgi:hypothetical protein